MTDFKEEIYKMMNERLPQAAPFAHECEERQLLLRDRNVTRQPFPQHLGIHQFFEAQVQQTPEAIVLPGEQHQLLNGETLPSPEGEVK